MRMEIEIELPNTIMQLMKRSCNGLFFFLELHSTTQTLTTHVNSTPMSGDRRLTIIDYVIYH
jgi:hypothetical protein